MSDTVYPAMFDYADGTYYCPCCSAKLKLYQIHEVGFGEIGSTLSCFVYDAAYRAENRDRINANRRKSRATKSEFN